MYQLTQFNICLTYLLPKDLDITILVKYKVLKNFDIIEIS